MLLKDNIAYRWFNIEQKKAAVSEALSWSASGRNLQKECKRFSGSKVIGNLIRALSDNSGNTIDRFKMAQYLALSIEHNPEENLNKFVEYLASITQTSLSKRRAGYYAGLMNAVIKLQGSKEFEHYMEVYARFKNDKDKNATLARDIMSEVTSSMKSLMGGYA